MSLVFSQSEVYMFVENGSTIVKNNFFSIAVWKIVINFGTFQLTLVCFSFIQAHQDSNFGVGEQQKSEKVGSRIQQVNPVRSGVDGADQTRFGCWIRR